MSVTTPSPGGYSRGVGTSVCLGAGRRRPAEPLGEAVQPRPGAAASAASRLDLVEKVSARASTCQEHSVSVRSRVGCGYGSAAVRLKRHVAPGLIARGLY